MEKMKESHAERWQGKISLFDSVKSNRAKELALPWRGLAELLGTPKVGADKKAGQLFSGALFKSRTRSNSNAKTLCLLVLDYDGGLPMEQNAQTDWGGVAYLAYTTWSHGTDKGHCYRVVIPLAEPIPAEQYPALWQWAHEQTGGVIDTACKDPARIMFLPACPEERRDLFRFVRHDGPALDWRALPLDTPEPEKAATARTGGAAAKNAYTDKALADAVRKVATAPEGERNPTLNREAYTLGQLAAADWNTLTRGEAERALLAAGKGSGGHHQKRPGRRGEEAACQA